MKVLRELKSKKILKSVLKGSLKTNVFLILLGIFFSTLAFAAALTITWEAGKIPGGNNILKVVIQVPLVAEATNSLGNR